MLWLCRNRRGGRWSHFSVVEVESQLYQSPCLCLLTSSLRPPLSLNTTNCTNTIRASETLLTEFSPFPPTPTYLKSFSFGKHRCFVCIFKTSYTVYQSYLQAPRAINPQISLPEDELAPLLLSWLILVVWFMILRGCQVVLQYFIFCQFSKMQFKADILCCRGGMFLDFREG